MTITRLTLEGAGLVAGVWQRLRDEADEVTRTSVLARNEARTLILDWPQFADALCAVIAAKLGLAEHDRAMMREEFNRSCVERPEIPEQAARDLLAILERDAACVSAVAPFLLFKGYHALQTYRFAHGFWLRGRRFDALLLQSRMSQAFAVDIHPACVIGSGVFIDHGTAVVVGETAVIEDNVSILQSVTLGGTGKEKGDRHPKVRSGVLIGAGAKVLGNIEVGEGAQVGAGSVVLRAVPAHRTVAGVPATIVGKPTAVTPALEMDQKFEERDGA